MTGEYQAAGLESDLLITDSLKFTVLKYLETKTECKSEE